MSRQPVRIELGRTTTGNHVWVGDVEITNLVTAVRVECSSHGGFVLKASIDVIPDAVKIVDPEVVEAIRSIGLETPAEEGDST